MQINSAYVPKVSEQARIAAMAEASLLLQDVGLMVTAKKKTPLAHGSRWTRGIRTARRF